MSTTLKLDELPSEVAALIRRMHDRDECIVVKDDEGPVAYFNLAYRPDLGNKDTRDFWDVPLPEANPPIVYEGPRRVPTANLRIGARLVTSEEINEELREDFP